MTDTAFNSSAFNYRYIVRDSVGATAQATLNITPTAYSAPTRSITVAGINTSSPETAYEREKGNVASNISATITRNSVNVPITGWQWQYRENSGSYIDIGSFNIVSGNPSPVSTGTTAHSTANTVSTANYRLKVTDAYQDSLGATLTSDSSTINYRNYIFYGPTGGVPSSSGDVRSLPYRALSISLSDPANPITLTAGTTYKDFTIALPSPRTVSLVQDLDASNATITTQYVLSASLTGVMDYAGTTAAYNVYTMSQSIPYSPSHRHSITRA